MRRTVPTLTAICMMGMTLSACGSSSGEDSSQSPPSSGGSSADAGGSGGSSSSTGGAANGGKSGASHGGTGGVAGHAGASAGHTGTAGKSGGTGGAGKSGSSNGGAASATGGQSSVGGSPAAGGQSSAGGENTGGMAAGGDSSAGPGGMMGQAGTGGDSATGGTGGSTAAGGSGGASLSCNLPAGHPDGSLTYYTFSQGAAAVNCSFDVLGQNPDVVAFVPFGSGQYFGALNTADYDTAAMCGACIQVDRADNGKSVQIMVVDQCPTDSNPKCISGHIDMSKQAFLQIGTEDEGYLGTTNGGAVGQISWKYIPCPETGNVTFRLKDPANMYWNEVLVEGHGYPIALVEVNVGGTWLPAVRLSYNYWQVGNGNIGFPPYEVRATDVNGSVVTATLSLEAGDQVGDSALASCQ